MTGAFLYSAVIYDSFLSPAQTFRASPESSQAIHDANTFEVLFLVGKGIHKEHGVFSWGKLHISYSRSKWFDNTWAFYTTYLHWKGF